MSPLSTALRAVVDTATYQRDAFNAGQRIAALKDIAEIEAALSRLSGRTDCSDERRHCDEYIAEMMDVCSELRVSFGGGQ